MQHCDVEHRLWGRRLPRGVPSSIPCQMISCSESDSDFSRESSAKDSSETEWQKAKQRFQKSMPSIHSYQVWDTDTAEFRDVTDRDAEGAQQEACTGKEEEIPGLEAPPGEEGTAAADGLPSIGSRAHPNCKPCSLLIKGCKAGADCAFCHLHPDYKRFHPSKDRRQRMKRRMELEQAAAKAAAAAEAT